jgi:hypothetical protein
MAALGTIERAGIRGCLLAQFVQLVNFRKRQQQQHVFYEQSTTAAIRGSTSIKYQTSFVHYCC